jgi:hypothetical protein
VGLSVNATQVDSVVPHKHNIVPNKATRQSWRRLSAASCGAGYPTKDRPSHVRNNHQIRMSLTESFEYAKRHWSRELMSAVSPSKLVLHSTAKLTGTTFLLVAWLKPCRTVRRRSGRKARTAAALESLACRVHRRHLMNCLKFCAVAVGELADEPTLARPPPHHGLFPDATLELLSVYTYEQLDFPSTCKTQTLHPSHVTCRNTSSTVPKDKKARFQPASFICFVSTRTASIEVQVSSNTRLAAH